MKRVADDIDVLMAIQHYRDAYGFSPSVRNLMMMLGYTTPSAVDTRIKSLAKKGLITRHKGIARSLKLTVQAFALLEKEKVA